MAKERETPEVSEEKSPAEVLAAAMRMSMMGSQGLLINVQGEERPYRLQGNKLTGVQVNSAWIGFTYNGCAFRTRSFEDRDNFWSAMISGGGTGTKACFTKNGILKRDEDETIVPAPSKKRSFLPRATRHYGVPPPGWGTDAIPATEE